MKENFIVHKRIGTAAHKSIHIAQFTEKQKNAYNLTTCLDATGNESQN